MDWVFPLADETGLAFIGTRMTSSFFSIVADSGSGHKETLMTTNFPDLERDIARKD
jgi:hypothetical protein